MPASALAPELIHFPLKPGRGRLVLHATGFSHPRVSLGGASFTSYADVTHLQLGSSYLRIGTRRSVCIVARSYFQEIGGPEALVRALLERVVAEPDGAAQLARMAEIEETARSPAAPRVTAFLIAVCLGLFGLEQMLGPRVHYAGFFNATLAVNGEGWRFLTANLLHGDPMLPVGATAGHLVFNLFGLLVLGHLVERPLGAVRMLFVCGLAALGSTGAGLLMDYPGLVGASGIVMGLAGALVWLEFRLPERLPAGWRVPRRLLVAALVGDALLSFYLPMVAGVAHVGGFLGGMLAASICAGRSLRRAPIRAPLAVAVAMVCVVSAVSIGAASRLALDSGSSWEDHASRLIEVDAPPGLMNQAAWLIGTADQATPSALGAALDLAERAVAGTDRMDANILDTLAEVQFRVGDADVAVGTIDEAIELLPDEPYFQEQRRRFTGERDADDRPPPPEGPFFLEPPPGPTPRFEPSEPGIRV